LDVHFLATQWVGTAATKMGYVLTIQKQPPIFHEGVRTNIVSLKREITLPHTLTGAPQEKLFLDVKGDNATSPTSVLHLSGGKTSNIFPSEARVARAWGGTY
ncbi:unnamed protein product, partial [Ectocarpus sp. 12 AP-2014]